MTGQDRHERPPRASQTTETCEAAALDYRRLGWSVIPLRPKEKVPKLPWQEFQDRRADEEEIRAWFKRWPKANLGVVTGPVSGLVVLDVDPRHGGEESLRTWIERHGLLPTTPEAETGGGGRHLYFATRDPELGNRVAVVSGIDLRGRGGMIVAPPSIHPSGRPYVWKQGHAPTELPLAPLPQWLHDRLSARMSGRGHPLAYWRSLARSGVEEGQRNNTIASFAGHLLWHGVEPEIALELLLSWNRTRCRPPLDDEEVARVVASIAKLHQAEDSRDGA
jgi:hypothetical protein